jgi:hypothetical protein
MKSPLAAFAGVALILVSGFFLFDLPSFTSRRDVLDAGGLTVSVSAEGPHPITPWLAAAAMIGGFALLVGAIRPEVQAPRIKQARTRGPE